MPYISIVPRNRELVVINDMDVFATFFCYAKRQKKRLTHVSHAVQAVEELDDIDRRQLAQIDTEGDEDLTLPKRPASRTL